MAYMEANFWYFCMVPIKISFIHFENWPFSHSGPYFAHFVMELQCSTKMTFSGQDNDGSFQKIRNILLNWCSNTSWWPKSWAFLLSQIISYLQCDLEHNWAMWYSSVNNINEYMFLARLKHSFWDVLQKWFTCARDMRDISITIESMWHLTVSSH